MSSHSEFIVPLLQSLRAEILAAYGQVDHKIKENLTVVTEIDKQVEQKLVNALREKFPVIGVHGEEHGAEGPTDSYWLIDPIDGTESYVRGLPGVTSIIGLVENGECTQSYIYDPVDDVMYSAFKGMGAYADERQIRVSNRPIERAIIAQSSGVMEHKPEIHKALIEAGVFYTTGYYGSGIKAVYMASGKIDGVLAINRPGGGGGPWDYIPTRMLMREAGAIDTLFDSNTFDPRSYSLLSPSINDIVVTKLKELLV